MTSTDFEGPTWDRLNGQIDWYNAKSKRNQQWYKVFKLAQILLGALVPVVAAADGSRVLLAALGAGVVVIEAVQQLFQFHRNWTAYRAACSALERERHLFQVRGGDYATATDPLVLLAERVEAVLSRETGEWADLQTSAQKPQPEPG